MFRHPKYYKELRKRNKALRSCDAYLKENSNYTERQQSDQAISLRARDGECERTPDSGLKRQASSDKQQASSKPEPVLVQQSSSNKRQA
jgi:hypothetical protein